MTGSGETLQSKGSNTMSEGEQRELHKRIENLEHELKVRFEKLPLPESMEFLSSENVVL
jgi:hypothetical protein